MTNEEAEKLISTIRGFVGEQDAQPPRHVKKGNGVDVGPGLAALHRAAEAPPVSEDLTKDVEKLYLYFKRRFIEEARVDPTLVRLIMVQPELEVEIERKVISYASNDGYSGRMAALIANGFFTETKTGGAVRKELARTGPDPGGSGSLYNPLKAFVRDGILTQEGDGFRIAPGVKVNTKTKTLETNS